jgi:hypothetical protein
MATFVTGHNVMWGIRCREFGVSLGKIKIESSREQMTYLNWLYFANSLVDSSQFIHKVKSASTTERLVCLY